MSNTSSANAPAKSIDWTGPAISVVSLGCSATSALTAAARTAIEQAEVIFGAVHHFEEIESISTAAEKIGYPIPLSGLVKLLAPHQQKRVTILASGDALFYGIGSWLNRNVGNANLLFHPNVSSIQACFHHIGLPWQQAQVVSLHSRPLASIRRYLANGRLIATFTDAESNPVAIAAELSRQGFGDSQIWVCEAMGSSEQRVGSYQAHQLATVEQNFHHLNICVIQLKGKNDRLATFPGIADDAFSSGSEPGFGMISKRETRLSILSLMQPAPDEIAWDIGAGCGSVSVEWARWNPSGKIYAIEVNEERIGHIECNSERFGTVQNLTTVTGTAPQCCASLPEPDCIFIGGSQGLEKMLDYAWQHLKPGGKLVATAVTEASRQALKAFMEQRAGHELIDIQVRKNLPTSNEIRELKPVLLAKCHKPEQADA